MIPWFKQLASPGSGRAGIGLLEYERKLEVKMAIWGKWNEDQGGR
jgi:hypothetical protein